MTAGVSILGVSEHMGRPGTTENLEHMIFGAARGALEASGLERADIDAVVIAASDQIDGRAISSMLTAGPAGAYMNDELNIASSPGHAFAMAWLAVLSGAHRRVLVSSWGSDAETATVGGSEVAERLSLDPFFERETLTPLAVVAFQAAAQRRRPQGEEAVREVVARSARYTGSRAESGEAPLLAFPLRVGEVAAPSAGAFSLVLAAAGAGPAVEGPVRVEGVGWSSDTSRADERDLLRLPHLGAAARDALAWAGVDGCADVDLFELHDYTADAEILACEAIGLCARDEGPAAVLAGRFGPDGAAHVNLTGGSLRGEAPFGGPLRKVLDATQLLRGKRGARRALVQIAGGVAGQFQTVVVLAREAT